MERKEMSTQSVVSQVVRNIVAIADVIVHAGEVQQNVDNMAKMLGKARRIERAEPLRASKLRTAARKLSLA
jgi:hypothetical protein